MNKIICKKPQFFHSMPPTKETEPNLEALNTHTQPLNRLISFWFLTIAAPKFTNHTIRFLGAFYVIVFIDLRSMLFSSSKDDLRILILLEFNLTADETSKSKFHQHKRPSIANWSHIYVKPTDAPIFPVFHEYSAKPIME